MRPQQLLNLLNRLGHPTKTKWNVRIMERYRHGAGVVTYLARYLRGGPIKNARLVAWDGERVTFTYRARQEEADGARPAAPADDLARRGLSPALAAACAGAPDAGRAVVWAVPSHATLRPWPSAVRRLASRRWRCRQRWTGRRCVPSGGTPIRSGVPPVGSCSCAPASSRGEVRLRRPGSEERAA